MKPSLMGLGLGLLAAAAMARLIQSQLFEGKAYNPAVFAGATALLAVVAVLAIYVPARRAARADPMLVLRQE